MKILGYTYISDNHGDMIFKSDSSLLINKKPFFLPSDEEYVALPCFVFRICRLGKSIEKRFVHRYLDGWTIGLNVVNKSFIESARAQGSSWTCGVAFDYSLIVGAWQVGHSVCDWRLRIDAQEVPIYATDWRISVEEAVERVSENITLRMGDMLFIDNVAASFTLKREMECRGIINDESLYCKIK